MGSFRSPRYDRTRPRLRNGSKRTSLSKETPEPSYYLRPRDDREHLVPFSLSRFLLTMCLFARYSRSDITVKSCDARYSLCSQVDDERRTSGSSDTGPCMRVRNEYEVLKLPRFGELTHARAARLQGLIEPFRPREPSKAPKDDPLRRTALSRPDAKSGRSITPLVEGSVASGSH